MNLPDCLLNSTICETHEKEFRTALKILSPECAALILFVPVLLFLSRVAWDLTTMLVESRVVRYGLNLISQYVSVKW